MAIIRARVIDGIIKADANKVANEMYSIERITEIINCASFACGIGSHRPSSKGDSNGMFHVESVTILG